MMNDKERARDLHYKLIEDCGLNGDNHVVRDLILNTLCECRNAAIDEAAKVVDNKHYDGYSIEAIINKIKELKE